MGKPKHREGRIVAKLPGLEVRAINGLVCMTNTNSGAFDQLTIKDAKERLRSLKNNLGKSTTPGIAVDATERRKVAAFLEECDKVVREAKEQGDPTREDVLKELSNRRSVQVGSVDMKDIK